MTKRELQNQIDSLRSQCDENRGQGVTIKELKDNIQAIVDYLDCYIIKEKSIETYQEPIFENYGVIRLIDKDKIVYTKKLVKKTKATKVATNKKNK